MSTNLIDKALVAHSKTTRGKTIRLASEPDEFEMIELPSLIMEFNDWLNDHPGGTWNDFLGTTNRKNLGLGGEVESYGDLIDAYEKGIDVMPDETLSDYIKRIKYYEMLKASGK